MQLRLAVFLLCSVVYAAFGQALLHFPVSQRSEKSLTISTYAQPEVLLKTSRDGHIRVTRHGPWVLVKVNNALQSCAFTGVPGDDAFVGGTALPTLSWEYLRTAASAAAAFSTAPLDGKRLLVAGLGGGSLPHFLAHVYRAALVQAVEVDDEMVDVAKLFLGESSMHFVTTSELVAASPPLAALPAPRFQVVVADAADVVSALAAAVGSNASAGVDVLFIDAFDGLTMPARLRTDTFLVDALSCLSPAGVLVSNCINGAAGTPKREALEAYVLSLLVAAGPAFEVFTIPVDLSHGNLEVVARRRVAGAPQPSLEALAAAASAASLVADWQFDGAESVARVFSVTTTEGGGAIRERLLGSDQYESSAMKKG